MCIPTLPEITVLKAQLPKAIRVPFSILRCRVSAGRSSSVRPRGNGSLPNGYIGTPVFILSSFVVERVLDINQEQRLMIGYGRDLKLISSRC